MTDLELEIKRIIQVWKYRQTCNNHPELSITSKAKARVYGIVAEELEKILERARPE